MPANIAAMSDLFLRPATPADFDAVAEIIHVGTNFWYQSHGMARIFGGDVRAARLFPEVYEELDQGCCLLAIQKHSGRIAGSCFYRIRPTHVSLGIMNVNPAYFGNGAARLLLAHITDLADQKGLPVRLVSSAMNLDSYSLYNRAGFIPRQLFQDMILSIPETGLAFPAPSGSDRVRMATTADVPAITELEENIQGIRRPGDWAYVIENRSGIWHTVVSQCGDGSITGALSSVSHPGSNLIGPGVATDAAAMIPLLWEQLHRRRGTTPVFLVAATETQLIQSAYAWGARNCELHVSQCRGMWTEPRGVVMPTFMPESA